VTLEVSSYLYISRKVLLLLDNFAAHISAVQKLENLPQGEGLKNTEICWLPANSTSKVQPLDQGIIKAFKAHYRAQWLQYMVDEYDVDRDPLKTVNILKAIRYSIRAWSEVTEQTITNCWIESTVNYRIIGPPTKRQFEKRLYLYQAQPPLDEQEQVAAIERLTHQLLCRQRIHAAMDLNRLLEPPEEVVDDQEVDLVEEIAAQYDTRADFEEEELLEEQPQITISEAIAALSTLRLFEEQSEQGQPKLVQQLNKYEKEIRKRQFQSLQQQSLDRYF
jgi:hypothetical protein